MVKDVELSLRGGCGGHNLIKLRIGLNVCGYHV